MKRPSLRLGNEEGSVLVVAIMILVLLTIIGISTSRTSEIELQIAGNEKVYKSVLYTADAGIEHLRALLNAQLMVDPANASRIAQGLPPLWTFALDGATTTKPDVTWINDAGLGGYHYTVTVWNNNDGGGPQSDEDSIIYARSDATGPDGAKSSIVVTLKAEATGTAYTGYTAQAGAGAGKSYTSDDLNAITDFSTQL